MDGITINSENEAVVLKAPLERIEILFNHFEKVWKVFLNPIQW